MFVVNSALDTPNPNSLILREVITASNAQPPGLQMIVFAPNMEGQTINLTSQLTIENHIYIAGPGSQFLTVTRDAAQGGFRLFEVKAG